MSEALTEIELKVLLAMRNKTVDEVASELGLEEEEISRHHKSASDKLDVGSVKLEMTEEPFVPIPTSFRLEEKIGHKQTGTMKVGSKILEMLSKGIYTAPWNSLKELISNSYDADATKVEIIYYPKEKKLVVTDDGVGMDYVDFDEHFTFIVKSDKRKKGLLTPKYKRPIIGKIGIGFIAVNELCEKIKVKSAKEKSKTYFEAIIDFSKIISEEAFEKEFYEVSKFELVNYEKDNIDDHYTIIELINIKESFLDILNNKSIEGLKHSTIYPKKIEDVIKKINNVRNIKSELGPFWQFLINLANVIPVQYVNKGPIDFSKIDINNEEITEDRIKQYNKARKIINNIKSTLKNYNFKVIFNGLELKKPILLPHQDEAKIYGKDMILVPIIDKYEMIDNYSKEEITIHYKGYFFYQRTRIIPEGLRGILIRIKNVAIGDPSLDFWEHPYSGDSMYFPQTYGEVYIESGLEEAMNIDRSTFKSTHPEFYLFRDKIHSYLRTNVFQTAKQLYGIRRKDKDDTKTDAKKTSRNNAVKNIYGKKYNIKEVRKFDATPVTIKKDTNTIQMNTLADQFDKFKKDDRILLQDVAIALEIAEDKAKTIKDYKALFWNALRELSKYRRSE